MHNKIRRLTIKPKEANATMIDSAGINDILFSEEKLWLGYVCCLNQYSMLAYMPMYALL